MRWNPDSTPAAPHRWLDPPLLAAVAAMASLGLLNLLSIGEYALAVHQLAALLLGGIAMAPLVRMRMGSWWTFGRGVYALAVTMLLAAAAVGAHAYGARRWLGVGALVVQPSELAKVGLLLVLAHLLGAGANRPRALVVALVVGLIPIGLTLVEPDLSTAILLGALLVLLLVLARAPLRVVGSLLAGAALLAPLGERALRPYQLARLHVFLGTGADPQSAWTVLQAHIAVASGGPLGAPPVVPHHLLAQYLPARESDLAFASLVEQHGLVAGVAVLVVATVLVARLVAAARQARTTSASLFAAGLAALVGSEVVVSVAGNLGLLPLAGIPCPLLSAGGTAALVHLVAIGIVIGGRRDAEARHLWRLPRRRRLHPRLARTLAAGVAAALAVSGFTAATLQGEGAGLRRAGVEQATRSIRLPAARGDIVDRHGTPLAVSDPDPGIVAVPRLLRSSPDAEAALANLLGRSPGDVDALLGQHADSLSVPVAARVLPDVAARIDAAHLPGVVVVHAPRRHYPAGSLLAPLLGFVGVATPDDVRRLGPLPPGEIVGRAGFERGDDTRLRGVDGAQQVLVDPLGRPVAMASVQPPTPGSTVRLSLDLGLQRAAGAALAAALRGSRGRTAGDEAAAVVMDARSGEVLAMASLPAYDDNLFGPPVDAPALIRTLAAGGDPFLEHATQTTAPPGSTFKLVMAAADAVTGAIPPDLVIGTGGALAYGGAVFHNWAALPPQDLRRAIAWSNDVYFYKLALALGAERIAAMARALGVGERTGVDLPGESAAYLGTPQSVARSGGTWFPGSTVILGIGQGAVTATPLQVARWTAAVSSGVLVTPHLGLDTTGASGTAPIATPAPQPLPFAAELGPVREGLRLAVVAGTGSQLRDLSVPAGGKTGTAEDPTTPGGAPDAWFTGVVPADRPEIAVTVMVRGGGEGFDTAEPAAAAILRHYLAHRADILAAGTAAGTPGPALAAPGPAASSPSTPRTPLTTAPPGAPLTRSTPAGRPPRRRSTRRRR
jgi:cell division protein FtsI/penicillin-binding protein 2/cell division protein FtsW (lipid II flippase)